VKKRNIVIHIDNISTKIKEIERDLKALLNGDEPFKEEFSYIKNELLTLKKRI